MLWQLFMATDAQVVLIHYESAQVLRYSWSFNQLAPVFCWILAPINTFSDSWILWRLRPLIHEDSYCYSHQQDGLLRLQYGCRILAISPKFSGFTEILFEGFQMSCLFPSDYRNHTIRISGNSQLLRIYNIICMSYQEP